METRTSVSLRYDFDPIAFFAPATPSGKIAESAERAFKSEVFLGGGESIEFGEKEAAWGDLSGGRVERRSPAASKSVLRKRSIFSRGRNVRAKVVLPAPLGPAMMRQRGKFREFVCTGRARQFRNAGLIAQSRKGGDAETCGLGKRKTAPGRARFGE